MKSRFGEGGSIEIGDALNVGQNPGAACVYESSARVGTFGTQVENVSGDPVELSDARLVNPDGIDVVGSRIVAVAAGEDGLGAARGWPPDVESPPPSWSDQHPVVGFELEPDGVVELWVGLEVDDSRETGSAEAVEIEYRTATGGVLVQRTVDRLIVTSTAECEE